MAHGDGMAGRGSAQPDAATAMGLLEDAREAGAGCGTRMLLQRFGGQQSLRRVQRLGRPHPDVRLHRLSELPHLILIQHGPIIGSVEEMHLRRRNRSRAGPRNPDLQKPAGSSEPPASAVAAADIAPGSIHGDGVSHGLVHEIDEVAAPGGVGGEPKSLGLGRLPPQPKKPARRSRACPTIWRGSTRRPENRPSPYAPGSDRRSGRHRRHRPVESGCSATPRDH